MAEVRDLNALWEQRGELPDNDVRITEIGLSEGLRVRLLLTRRGTWPKHTEATAETYVILRGEVHYTTDREFTVRAGQMVTFAPGEAHAARIEQGALSLNVDAPGHRG